MIIRRLYNELEQRKVGEVEAVLRDFHNIQMKEKDLRSKHNILEREYNGKTNYYLKDLKFENSKLKQEAQINRHDLDHLTKIVEESDFIIKSVKEKVDTYFIFFRRSKLIIQSKITRKKLKKLI